MFCNEFCFYFIYLNSARLLHIIRRVERNGTASSAHEGHWPGSACVRASCHHPQYHERLCTCRLPVAFGPLDVACRYPLVRLHVSLQNIIHGSHDALERTAVQGQQLQLADGLDCRPSRLSKHEGHLCATRIRRAAFESIHDTVLESSRDVVGTMIAAHHAMVSIFACTSITWFYLSYIMPCTLRMRQAVPLVAPCSVCELEDS